MSAAAKEAEFLAHLRSLFQTEAEERLTALANGLIGLERTATDEERAPIIESIFREAHSLKGAAGAVNLTEFERVCQHLESLLSALKRRVVAPGTTLFDTAQRCADVLRRLLAAGDSRLDTATAALIDPLVADLDALTANRPVATARAGPPGDPPPAAVPPPPDAADASVSPSPLPPPAAAPAVPEARVAPEVRTAVMPDTVRIATRKLDSLLLEAEEMLPLRLRALERPAALQATLAQVEEWRARWRASVAHDARNGAEQAPAPPEVDEMLQEFKSLELRLTQLIREAGQDARMMSGTVLNLLQDLKRVLLLPFATLTELFPKMTRDIARDQGKEVDLVLRGTEIEVDRRILEELKDPLIHLLRNALDHGIEKPADRARAGKPARARLEIAICQVEGNKIEIRLSDDGDGIRAERVKAAAVKKGIITADEARLLSTAAALDLIFRSDVSTAPIITDLSGRGLGMAIAKEKIEKLRGTISLETTPGAGTTFRILLPVTLAVFRGIMVRVADRQFTFSTQEVEQVVRIRRGEIKTVENRETAVINGRVMAHARLATLLKIDSDPATDDGAFPAVVVGGKGRWVAISVDEIQQDLELQVKGLGPQLARVRHIAAACLLGSGRVVPILHVADLIDSVARLGVVARPVTPAQPAKAGAKSLLVVEDSVTARSLLRNILEAAGYHVKTAVDGQDALALLKTAEFHLVVSDVQMPRLDGFGLTMRIRADKKLADLPVVLVTSLDSREDREQGIEAGANAYIVKGSFDQGNLLEVIARLI